MGRVSKNEDELTLRNGLFAVTPANTDSVDEIALLGLVSQTTSLVRTRRAGCTVYNVQLTVFPASTPMDTVSSGQTNFHRDLLRKKQRNSGQEHIPHTE
jgi:hypothetical protein